MSSVPVAKWLTGCGGTCLMALAAVCARAQETPVFRSDIQMGRVDVQVVDRYDLALGGLTSDDFELRYRGEKVPIRDFQFEDMPLDVVLLLDTSGSMRPQVQRVASASQRALAVLGRDDRVAVITFTTGTRTRLKLTGDLAEVEKKLDDVVERYGFGGGTDINGALIEAAGYLAKEGRKDARRAIVIVTDDIAPPCNQIKVAAALSEADTLVMALLAPHMLEQGGGQPGGGPQQGGGWPGGPLGGVIWGPRRSPYPTGGPRGGAVDLPSAGTAHVARDSGGESIPVNETGTLETTFSRIRKRYSIYYYLPEGAGATSDDTGVAVDLTKSARTMNPGGELRYRQVFLAGKTRRTFVKRVILEGAAEVAGTKEAEAETPIFVPGRRRRGVDEGGGPRVAVAPVETSGGPAEAAGQTPGRRRRPVSEQTGPRVSSIPGRP